MMPRTVCRPGTESIRQAAQQGSSEAQNKLGCFYEFGSGVPVDRKEAVKWFRMAADRGRADAQFNLGCCLEYGRGIRKDEGKAVELYRKSASEGDACGLYNLGRCYRILGKVEWWIEEGGKDGPKIVKSRKTSTSKKRKGVCHA